jgi:hypothetical protein
MLTCQDLEDYFDESIKYGYSQEDSEEEKEKVARAKEKETKNRFVPDYATSRETSPTKKDEGGNGGPMSPPKKGVTVVSIPMFNTPPTTPGGAPSNPTAAPATPAKAATPASSKSGGIGKGDKDFSRAKRGLKIMAKKWLWGAIASMSLGLGVMCFTMARRFKLENTTQRRWTNR